jgi:hypothetical protein
MAPIRWQRRADRYRAGDKLTGDNSITLIGGDGDDFLMARALTPSPAGGIDPHLCNRFGLPETPAAPGDAAGATRSVRSNSSSKLRRLIEHNDDGRPARWQR